MIMIKMFKIFTIILFKLIENLTTKTKDITELFKVELFKKKPAKE